MYPKGDHADDLFLLGDPDERVGPGHRAVREQLNFVTGVPQCDRAALHRNLEIQALLRAPIDDRRRGRPLGGRTLHLSHGLRSRWHIRPYHLG